MSNVRDQNYSTPKTPDGATYIGGFFTSTLNNALDRNVMTIDSWDWIHRTGANPPGEVPPDGTADIRSSSTEKARPRNYEGIFAHEYQHLLHYYTDPGEDTWLNEGLSDYAQTLVGYVDTTIPYGQVRRRRPHHLLPGLLRHRSLPLLRRRELLDTDGPTRARPPSCPTTVRRHTFINLLGGPLRERSGEVPAHEQGQRPGVAAELSR